MKHKTLTYSTTITLHYEHQKLNNLSKKLRSITSEKFRGCNLENKLDTRTSDLVLIGDLQPSEVYSRGRIGILTDECVLMITYDYGTDQITALKNFHQSYEYIKSVSQVITNPGFVDMHTALTYEFDDFEGFSDAIRNTFYEQLISNEHDSVGYRFASYIRGGFQLKADVYNSTNKRIILRDHQLWKEKLIKLNVEFDLSSSDIYLKTGLFNQNQIDNQFVVFDDLLRKLQFRDILTGKIR